MTLLSTVPSGLPKETGSLIAPIRAKRLVQRMRGGSQAFLLEGENNDFYVVKFVGNPQHRRVLVNEWISAAVFRYLRIATPPVSLIEITPEFLRIYPDLCFHINKRNCAVEPGLQFGSRYPGNPSVVAVYDFMPKTLLAKVSNLTDFIGCFVCDKWMANSDGRQCVFYHSEPDVENSLPLPRRMAFRALMIDHGFAFNGPHWNFRQSAVQGIYSSQAVYNQVRSLDSFQPWLDQLTHFPESVINEALRQIPLEWIVGEEDNLQRLLDMLYRRCRCVRDFILDTHLAKTNPFLNWKPSSSVIRGCPQLN